MLDPVKSDQIEVEAVPMIPNAVQPVIAKLKDAISLKKLRGLVPFAGIGQPNPYNIPSKDQFMIRVRGNVVYFASNYAAAAAIVSVIAILMNPLFLLVILMIIAGWVYVGRIAADGTEIVIGGRTITTQQRTIGMLCVTALLIVVFGGPALFTIATVSGLFVTGHSITRNFTVPVEDDIGFSKAEYLPVAEKV